MLQIKTRRPRIENERKTPPRNASTEMHIARAAQRVTQTLGKARHSANLRYRAFVPQLEQEEPCKFSFVSSTLTEGPTFVALSSNWLGNWTFNPGTRVRTSLALILDLVTQWLEYAPFKRRVVGSNPTRVINRLIAQWIERLPSKVKVLGSNPSKAIHTSVADRIMHRATNAERVGSIPAGGTRLPLAQWQRRSLTKIRLNVQIVHGRNDAS